jgi:glutamine synthetase
MEVVVENSASTSVAPAQPLTHFLGKNPGDFTRSDLVKYVGSKNICRLMLRYIALDARLREMCVPISSESQLHRILARGERTDGSSLFPGIFQSSESDLYLIPDYSTAFHDPFDPHALSILCRYFGTDGLPVKKTPDEILRRASEHFKAKTGYDFWAFGEMEYYLILDKKDDRFTGLPQRNYHQAAPFSHGGAILRDIVEKLNTITDSVKYGHCEVGYLDSIQSEDAELNGKRVEQQEIEFLLRPAYDAVNMMVISKWVIRNCAARAGASCTFTPKLDLAIAGSGMHVHMALYKDEKNAMLNWDKALSDDAVRMVGGILKRADIVAALGNTVASSYLRLRSGMETPAAVCWGERNRNAMIRVPLGWRVDHSMETVANPDEPEPYSADEVSQTVELRTPDASAFKYLMLTTVILAAEEGLISADSLEFARKLYVKAGAKTPEGVSKPPSLPGSCSGGADAVERNRGFLEADNLVPVEMVDHVLNKLRNQRDSDLPTELSRLPQEQRDISVRRIMHKDLHKR